MIVIYGLGLWESNRRMIMINLNSILNSRKQNKNLLPKKEIKIPYLSEPRCLELS